MIPQSFAKRSIALINRLSGLSQVTADLRQNWLRSMNIRAILDVGAHKGESAEWFHKSLPEAKIVSFEPQSDCYANLISRMEGVSNFTAYNFALGDRNDTHIFYRSAHTPSSSLLEMGELHKIVHPKTANLSKTSVEIRRLDDIVNSMNLEPEFLLKMDTQGYEYQVLLGAKDILMKTSVIISEILYQNLYEGQSEFSEIFQLLSGKGFAFRGTWAEGRRSPINGLPLYADVIFIREPKA